MLIYMEFAGIHHKLHKQGLFNLNVLNPLPKAFHLIGTLRRNYFQQLRNYIATSTSTNEMLNRKKNENEKHV